jgi:uncharacterized protein involved in type VI secretion and phage assembly
MTHEAERAHLMPGLVVGNVTSVEDPDGEGKVEIEFPWMEGRNRSFWAAPATMMAGAGRGSYFMPEQGDEVLVGFDHGRVEFPFIVGYLWNGASQPPDDDIDPSVRRIRTVSGHTIDFDDRDDSKKIRITSSSGHEITLDDQAKSVTVETAGIELPPQPPHKIVLDDQNRVARIESGDGHKVELSDSGSKILIASKANMSIEIDSAGAVKINAPLSVEVTTLNAKFTGTLEAQILRAKLANVNLLQANVIVPTVGDIRGL